VVAPKSTEDNVMVKLLDGLSLTEIEALMIERRFALASKAAKIYSQCHSLRKAADQMGISHESVRALLSEAGIEADGKRGPRRTEAVQ
jgi:DNA-directed RNA polymerase sigma subunit (sigma70/sigma32)